MKNPKKRLTELQEAQQADVDAINSLDESRRRLLSGVIERGGSIKILQELLDGTDK